MKNETCKDCSTGKLNCAKCRQVSVERGIMRTEFTPKCECGLPATDVFNGEPKCKNCMDLRGEASIEDLGDRQRHLRSVGETDNMGRLYK